MTVRMVFFWMMVLSTTVWAKDTVDVMFEVAAGPIKAKTSTNKTAPSDTFTTDAPLTIRVFFPDTLRKAFGFTDEKYMIKVRLRFHAKRGTQFSTSIWIAKSEFERKYVDLELVPGPNAATKYEEGNSRTLIGWAGYEQTAKMVMAADSVTVSLSANSVEVELPKIKIDFSKADVKKLAKLSDQVQKQGETAFSKNFGAAKAGMRDKKLEAQLVAMWLKNHRDVKKAKAVITSDAWAIDEDQETGRANYRQLDVEMVSQKKNGKCFSEEVGVREDAKRKGFGPPSFAGVGASELEIDCGKGFGKR